MASYDIPRPPRGFPAASTDAPLAGLLICLPPIELASVLALVLTEQRVLLRSRSAARAAGAARALRALLFPLDPAATPWGFVPLLPKVCECSPCLVPTCVAQVCWF